MNRFITVLMYSLFDITDQHSLSSVFASTYSVFICSSILHALTETIFRWFVYVDLDDSLDNSLDLVVSILSFTV